MLCVLVLGQLTTVFLMQHVLNHNISTLNCIPCFSAKMNPEFFLEVAIPWAFCAWLLWSEWMKYCRS